MCGLARPLLTPAYASPEQVKGEATTTATDVYGLGTLLYRLLTGTSPHPSGNASTEQVIRAICEIEPAPVSKAAAREDSTTKSQSLSGDIDNIVAKTLRKEPENRYTSVSELQKDIERFLRGEPVLATPPGFLYRGGKFIRRYPAASLLALSVFVAISGGLAASTHLANKLRNERDNLLAAKSEIEHQAHTAQRVTQLLMDMFAAASPENARGRTVNVDELLDSAVSNTRESLQGEPAVKAQLLRTLAQVKFNTGKHKDAVALQREAMAIDKDSSDQSALAADLSKLGDYLRETGEQEAAEESLTRARELLRHHTNAQLLAMTQLRQGLLLLQQGKPKKAIEFFNAAQEYWRLEDSHGSELGMSTRHHLAIAYYDIADFASATRLEESVLQERIAFYGRTHPKTLSSFQFLGQCYMRVNRWGDAQKHLEHAYQTGQNIFSKDNITFRTTARQYANLMRRLGYYQRAVDILTDLLDVDAQNEESTAHILNSRGYAYFEQGMMKESRRDLERANEIFSRLLPDSSSISFLTRSNLGETMTLTGDLDAGIALIEKIRLLNAEQYGEDDYGVAASYFRFARIALREAQLEKAQQYVEMAREINRKYYTRNHPLQLEIDEVEAGITVAKGALEQARVVYEKLIKRMLEVFPAEAPLLAKQRSALGEVLWRQGKRKEGAHLVRENQSRLRSQLPPASIHIPILQARAELVGNKT